MKKVENKTNISNDSKEGTILKDVEKENNKTDEVVEEVKEEQITEETAKILEGKNVLDSNENEQPNEEKTKKDGLYKYTVAIAIISVLLLIGIITFSTIFAFINRKSNKIVSGISITGVDVSGLTYDDAKNKINNTYQNKLKQGINLKHNDYQVQVTPEQIEVNFGINESIDLAYGIGRSGKILKDNYSIINAKINKIDITPSMSYNEKALDEVISSIATNLPDKVKQSEYHVDGQKLVISKGQDGVSIDNEKLKNIILENILNANSTEIIEIPTIDEKANQIDIQKIHNEIYKEAKDAYYTTNPFTIYPHETGLDFNVEEAQQLLDTQQDQITIPLKVSNPNITTNQIGTEAFPNLLASYSTKFATSNTNRSTNIRLASNKINGVVLLPGEEFSYNNVVGRRTEAAGYKTAQVYVNGNVSTGVGGGICQVSSTLYNATLKANLEIIKRYNHHFAATYVPLSQDATVSWGGPDFVFKNSRKYPIKIVSSVNGGTIKVDIYGCKEDVEYEVIIQSEKLSTISMKTEYRTNKSLPAGTQKVVQKGHGGYKSRAYRILKLDGKVISKQLLSTDTYAQLPTIIEKN